MAHLQLTFSHSIGMSHYHIHVHRHFAFVQKDSMLPGHIYVGILSTLEVHFVIVGLLLTLEVLFAIIGLLLTPLLSIKQSSMT